MVTNPETIKGQNQRAKKVKRLETSPQALNVLAPLEIDSEYPHHLAGGMPRPVRPVFWDTWFGGSLEQEVLLLDRPIVPSGGSSTHAITPPRSSLHTATSHPH
jgi:hypothetical protein